MALGAPDMIALPLFFVFWYAGNMKFNEYNTAALNEVGGKDSGMTMIVSTAQVRTLCVHCQSSFAHCLRNNPC